MRKISFTLLLLIATIACVKAQDYTKVRTLFLLSQAGSDSKLEEAKAAFDKEFANPKAQGKPEGYALKTEIYGTIAGSEALRAKYPNAAAEAYQALQKYLELEPSEAILKDDRYAGINGLYNAYYSEGIKAYNAKNWDVALDNFKLLVPITDMYIARKWSTTAFDTTTYLLAGVSAQNAKKNDDAAVYFGKIAQQKLGGADLEGVYAFMTKYYSDKNDQANFQKYVDLAKQVYPDNSAWKGVEFNYMSENTAPEEMAKRYDEASASNKLSAENYIDYGDYFMNGKKVKELGDAKRSEYSQKALDAFAKAYALDTTNGLASYNAGIASYAMFDNLNDAAHKIIGATADIKAKRAQAYKTADAAANVSIDWFEKCYRTLSAKTTRSTIEKGVLNKTVDLLYNLYEFKKDRNRGVNVKEYDKYDAKSKFYDSKHNKF